MHTGSGSNTKLRSLLDNVDYSWKNTNQSDLNTLIEGSEKYDFVRRINWHKAYEEDGKTPDMKVLNPLRIRQDFWDRLITGDVTDLDDYEAFVEEIDTQYAPILDNDSLHKALHRLQNKFFKSEHEKISKPREMIELLNEYLTREGLLPENHAEGEAHLGKAVMDKLEAT